MGLVLGPRTRHMELRGFVRRHGHWLLSKWLVNGVGFEVVCVGMYGFPLLQYDEAKTDRPARGR